MLRQAIVKFRNLRFLITPNVDVDELQVIEDIVIVINLDCNEFCYTLLILLFKILYQFIKCFYSRIPNYISIFVKCEPGNSEIEDSMWCFYW